MPVERVSEAQGHKRFARAWSGCADVDTFGHGPPFAVRGAGPSILALPRRGAPPSVDCSVSAVFNLQKGRYGATDEGTTPARAFQGQRPPGVPANPRQFVANSGNRLHNFAYLARVGPAPTEPW